MSVRDALEPRAIELLKLIASSSSPVGARELGRRLDGGQRLSESTLNRLLRRLDEQGLTRSLDGRGRIASEAGRVLAARADAERSWTAQLGALEIRTLADVRDLLVARRGVEREIVRCAAEHINDDGVAQLRASLDEYDHAIDADSERRDVAVSFHKALANVIDNNVLRAVALVVFDPRFDVLEQVLDVVTASRGTTLHSPREHEVIMKGILAGDADAAEKAMVRHLDRLLADASAVVAPSTRLAIELLLQKEASRGTRGR